MALVLRFVDKGGILQERFFDLIHVANTNSLTLKDELTTVLSTHGSDIQNLRGQGYDGANNMRGDLNGLQALSLQECPYAYYVHCYAHRLQLALVDASKVMDLLSTSATLIPGNKFRGFKASDICEMVKKYYPADFTQQDIYGLQLQLIFFYFECFQG
jgi:hypothetical protein